MTTTTTAEKVCVEELHQLQVAGIVFNHWRGFVEHRRRRRRKESFWALFVDATYWRIFVIHKIFSTWRRYAIASARVRTQKLLFKQYGVEQALFVADSVYLTYQLRHCWRLWRHQTRHSILAGITPGGAQDFEFVSQRHLLRQTWNLWAREAQRRQELTQLGQRRRLRRLWYRWKFNTELFRNRKQATADEVTQAQRYLATLHLRQVFQYWVQLTQAKQSIEFARKLVERSALTRVKRAVWLHWAHRLQTSFMVQQAAKVYQTTLLRQGWKDWVQRFQDVQALQQRALQLAQQVSTVSVLRRWWHVWRERLQSLVRLTQKVQVAAQHAQWRSLRLRFRQWRSYIQSRQVKRAETHEAFQLHTALLLRRGVRQWIVAGTQQRVGRLARSAELASQTALRRQLAVDSALRKWREYVSHKKRLRLAGGMDGRGESIR